MTAAPLLVTSYPNIAWEEISIALIGPDDSRRAEAAHVLSEYRGVEVCEYTTYPDALHELPKIIDQQYDVVILDLDSNPKEALRIIETICAYGKETVMVYSSLADSELVVRCMQAGAREFLTMPLKPGAVEEALVRASVRRPKIVTRTVRSGRVMMFLGAKGGVGVTSIACNFAVALAQERGHKTVLIDLDLPFGDAGLNLGISSEYSAISALQSIDRMDGALLSKLLVKHRSGLRVMAAPGRFSQFQATPDAIEKLLAVARQEFDTVVVDLGAQIHLMSAGVHRETSRIYLVTQAGIPELRNANRLINEAFHDDMAKVEIVLNRYQSRTINLTEKNINEALTRPVQWKIPNDHALVRKMQVEAAPLVLSDNAMARAIRQMAQAANGKPAEPDQEKKKTKKGLFF